MKKNIIKVLNKIKYSYNKFPITIFLVFILTILYTLNIDIGFMKYVHEVLLLSVGPIFLIETINKKKIINYIVVFLISILFTIILKYDDFINRIVLLYSSITWIYSIYFNYKNSKQSFEKYLSNVLINIFKSAIVYLILVIGSALVGFLFESLIFSSNFDLVLKLETLVLGFYLIPQLLYSLCTSDNELYNFSKVVLKYVLAPLVILSFLIIYIYMAKILILWEIPSNQIFRILALLFIIGCPIWTAIIGIDENSLIDKINKKLPIFFIPFIFLQIYSILVRIYNNGITVVRYLGLAFVLFEIIYIIIYLVNNKKIYNLFHVLSVMLIVSIIIPFINMFNISKISQYNNLKIYKEKSEYTQSEKLKIKGAYYYLEDLGEEKLINKLLTEDDKEKISNFVVSDGISKIEFLSTSIEEGKINIEGYKKLEEINISLTDDENNNYIREKIEDYLKHKENINEYFKENNEIVYDNKKLIFTYIDINYDIYNLNIIDYYILGYMLYK